MRAGFFARFIGLTLVLVVTVVALSTRACIAGSSPIVLSDESKLYNVFEHAEYLDDPTGMIDIDDAARSTAFRAPDGSDAPAGGARWYRFRVSAPASSDGDWFLFTNLCDNADLYMPNGPSTYSLQSFGYRVPYALHPAPFEGAAIQLRHLVGQKMFVRLQCEKTWELTFITAQFPLRHPGSIIRGAVFLLAAVLAILAFGLALIAKSRAYALVGLTSVLGGIRWELVRFREVFAHLSSPPFFVLRHCVFIAVIVVQALFYERFLEMRTRYPRLYIAMICSVVAIALEEVFSPFEDATLLAYAPQDAFYGSVMCVALISVRRGNPASWFVFLGAAYYIVSANLQGVTYAFGLPNLLIWPFLFAFPIDAMLFILGVGASLRQASVAYEAALVERDAVAQSLLDERQNHIRSIEQRNASFARFVPGEFLRQLDRPDILDVTLGDYVERDMAVLFADIRGFTGVAERLSPKETLEFINVYLGRMGPLIREHNGFIDKYIGDAIVGLFPHSANDAMNAAIAIQRETRRLDEDRARNGEEPIAVGIGIHYGRLILGTVGEPDRLDTTVIADAVNVASRLEGMSKVYGASIISSASLVDALDSRTAYCLRRLGDIALRGHRRAEPAYEVFDGDPHQVVLHKRRTLERFEEGIDALHHELYASSLEIFTGISAANTLDIPAAYLRERSEQMLSEQPTEREGAGPQESQPV